MHCHHFAILGSELSPLCVPSSGPSGSCPPFVLARLGGRILGSKPPPPYCSQIGANLAATKCFAGGKTTVKGNTRKWVDVHTANSTKRRVQWRVAIGGQLSEGRYLHFVWGEKKKYLDDFWRRGWKKTTHSTQLSFSWINKYWFEFQWKKCENGLLFSTLRVLSFKKLFDGGLQMVAIIMGRNMRGDTKKIQSNKSNFSLIFAKSVSGSAVLGGSGYSSNFARPKLSSQNLSTARSLRHTPYLLPPIPPLSHPHTLCIFWQKNTTITHDQNFEGCKSDFDLQIEKWNCSLQLSRGAKSPTRGQLHWYKIMVSSEGRHGLTTVREIKARVLKTF